MGKIYQLKITLKGSNPSIWRRFLVNEDISLHKLHEIIQTVMGWKNDHLYTFAIKGKNYNGQPEPDGPEEKNYQNRNTQLNKVVNRKNKIFCYDYDFENTWKHDIILEKTTEKESNKLYPICIKGENACPPESIGGIYGYYEVLEDLKNGKLNEGEIESIFGYKEFNPEKFSIDQVNKKLQKRFSISQDILDRYKDPVRKLIYLGDPRKMEKPREWINYLSLGITKEDIPQLIEILQDKDLYYSDSDNDPTWTSLHAWRALAQLKSKEAIIPLINMIVNKELEDDDWIREEIPEILGILGEDSIEPLKAYLYDESKPEWPKVIVSHSLEQVGQKVTSKREEIIKIFSKFLDNSTEEIMELNGFIVSYLTKLNAAEAIDSIRNAYSRKIVDYTINGNLESTEIRLGLREATPKKSLNLPQVHTAKTITRIDKIGRNEPCSCGSGKKYKKCCLQ